MLLRQGLHPVLARLLRRARRARRAASSTAGLDALLPPATLLALRHAPRRCSPTRSQRSAPMLIVADYDCDGATACAVGLRALRAFGATRRLSRAQPLRVRLRPHAARSSSSPRAAAPRPDRHRRQRHRQRRRRRARQRARHRTVLVTDHHLPGAELPEAELHRQSEPARLRVPEQVHRRRRRDVLRDARAARRAAPARRVRRQRAEPQSRRRCSTWSRSAPSPTWCGSTATTASWSRRA